MYAHKRKDKLRDKLGDYFIKLIYKCLNQYMTFSNIKPKFWKES